MLDFTALKLDDQSPIYQQVVRYVKLAIISGAASSGEELPSRRFLSALLGVNPNTIQKACRLMEEEGFLQSAAGSGSTLSFTPELAEEMKRALLREETLRYLDSVKKMGLDRQAVLALVEDLWERETGGEER